MQTKRLLHHCCALYIDCVHNFRICVAYSLTWSLLRFSLTSIFSWCFARNWILCFVFVCTCVFCSNVHIIIVNYICWRFSSSKWRETYIYKSLQFSLMCNKYWSLTFDTSKALSDVWIIILYVKRPVLTFF